MKRLGTLTEEILGLLEKEKDIEHEIADWNIRRDIRKGIQKIEDYLKPTSGSASEQILIHCQQQIRRLEHNRPRVTKLYERGCRNSN